MNQNDMDRYYWRTGHRWSGDSRGDVRWRLPLSRWIWAALAIGTVVTYSLLYLHL